MLALYFAVLHIEIDFYDTGRGVFQGRRFQIKLKANEATQFSFYLSYFLAQVLILIFR